MSFQDRSRAVLEPTQVPGQNRSRTEQDPDPTRPDPISPCLVTSGRQAESVTREPRSGSRWRWWREVNPIDGETCAQPWTNTGALDADHAAERILALGIGERHRCSPCDVTWRGESACFICGEVGDDDWTRAGGYGHSDGLRRGAGRLP
jgi:hypothetical protein